MWTLKENSYCNSPFFKFYNSTYSTIPGKNKYPWCGLKVSLPLVGLKVSLPLVSFITNHYCKAYHFAENPCQIIYCSIVFGPVHSSCGELEEDRPQPRVFLPGRWESHRAALQTARIPSGLICLQREARLDTPWNTSDIPNLLCLDNARSK